MELDDSVYERVEELSERGNELMDAEQYDEAIKMFEEALELLPTPWFDWEAATWLYAAIGDAYFLKEDFSASKDAFFDALNCPNAHENPFIHLRTGESLYELEELDRAADHFMRAYLLGGKKVFEEEPDKYIDFLRNRVDHL